jgi:hypothetical protein
LRTLIHVNWRVRTLLIAVSAVGLYLLLAWALASDSKPATQRAYEQRVETLEEGQAQDRELLQATQEAQGRGTLFRLLVSNPALGATLLKGWNSQRLTAELGWPDKVQGMIWTYGARTQGGSGLRVIVNGAGQVGSVNLIPPSADTKQ